MSQVDEGLIHAWLDGQLPADEAVRVEQLVANDAAWSAAAADARGVVAGASRILGALDDVPSVRQFGGSGGATNARRSVWRAPWVRAAAGLALIAGVGSLVVREWPSDQKFEPTSVKDVAPEVVHAPQSQNAAPLPGATSPTREAALPDAGARSAPTAATRQSAKRDETANAKAESRLDSARAGGAAGAVSGAASGAVSGAVTGAGAAATAQSVAVDSLKVKALALQKPAPAVASIDSGARVGAGGGRGGGRAGRAALGGRAVNAVAGASDQAMAKSVAETQRLDPRVSGCWLAIDSISTGVYVLKFIDPIATDVLRAAAPLVERGTVGASAPPRPLPPSPADARVQNATPRMVSADSSFRAEWVTGNEQTTLMFALRGDTLTGTTRRSAGDVVNPIVPFRATRVQCPR